MHPSHHQHLRAHPVTRRTAKVKVLELVVVAVVFVLVVSFGMYFEKKASTGSSSTSSKQVLLLLQQQQQTQQQGGPAFDALIHQAEVDRDETWQETVGQLKAEIKQLSSDIGKMVHPRRIPADCMARLGPQVDGRLFAPPSAEGNGQEAREMTQAAEKEEAGEEGGAEKETTAAAAAAAALLIKDLQAEVEELKQKAATASTEASSSAPSVDSSSSSSSSINEEDGLTSRLQTLQEQTGYSQIATLNADSVMSELFSHMVPCEKPNRMPSALLIGNKQGKEGKNDTPQLTATHLDSLQDLQNCATLNVVMTSDKPGTCHVLLPMDQPSVSRTIFSHASETDVAGKQVWKPFAKAVPEAKQDISPFDRHLHEEALKSLYASLPEIETQVGGLLQGLVGPPEGGGAGGRKRKKAAPVPAAAAAAGKQLQKGREGKVPARKEEDMAEVGENEENDDVAEGAAAAASEEEEDDDDLPLDEEDDGTWDESEENAPEEEVEEEEEEEEEENTRHRYLRRRRLQSAAASPVVPPSPPTRPFVHVMILNSGNLPVYLNMMCSASTHGLPDFKETLLIFAADEEVHTVLTKLGYVSYQHEAFGSFGKEEHRAYGDRQFLQMMWLKTVAGWLVNRLGYDLLYLDSDLVMFKDTYALFEKEEERGVDVFMQDDGARSDRFGPYFGNTGFFFVRANGRTRALLQAMLFSYEWVLAWRSHQAVFSYLLEDHYLRNNLSIKILPLEALPTGKVYHHLKGVMAEMVEGKRKDTLYLFHMNWALNNQEKIEYLKELGWWYIDDDRCNSPSLPPSIKTVSDCCIVPEPVTWPPEDKETAGETRRKEIVARTAEKAKQAADQAKEMKEQ